MGDTGVTVLTCRFKSKCIRQRRQARKCHPSNLHRKSFVGVSPNSRPALTFLLCSALPSAMSFGSSWWTVVTPLTSLRTLLSDPRARNCASFRTTRFGVYGDRNQGPLPTPYAPPSQRCGPRNNDAGPPTPGDPTCPPYPSTEEPVLKFR